MSIVDRFKQLLGEGSEPQPDLPHFIYVHLPEQLEPDEREARYGEPLDTELRLARLGEVSGGGALFEAPDEHGDREMIHCGVDVDTADLDSARTLLREQLPLLGCREGTCLDFRDDEGEWRDVFDGEAWRLRQPRAFADDE